jgi:hypothetical protein
MNNRGWKELLKGWPWFKGEGSFPILPNSEFMPPVRLGRKPYGTWDTLPLSEKDPWGWPISEYEEALTLRPGLIDIAHHVYAKLIPLCQGEEEHGISPSKLQDNPFWPPELANCTALEHERFVLLLPLALSLTQDDKAHIRWTLFGNSEQGPSRAFWKGFYSAPGVEVPSEQSLNFFRDLLGHVYDEPAHHLEDLLKAGFRILPEKNPLPSFPAEGPLPSWTSDYVIGDRDTLRGVKYLLTFRPFRDMPAAVRRKYLAGELHLLPFPGSLIFWGVTKYTKLAEHIHLATQVPLLHLIQRHEIPGKIRIPQSGWFKEPGPNAPTDGPGHLPIRDTYKRPFRQARVHRHGDNLANAREHRMAHVLFSTSPKDIDLYHKPMARNVQLWTDRHLPLLDGPAAKQEDIRRAAETIEAGGVFGYRFVFPAMNVGRHEVIWHRPLCAYLDRHANRPALLPGAPLGYLTAYRLDETGIDKPLELWPRLLHREAHATNIELFHGLEEKPLWQTLINVKKLLDAYELEGSKPLPWSLANQLLTIDKSVTIQSWLRTLQHRTPHHDRCRQLVEHLNACIAPPDRLPFPSKKKDVPPSLTYSHTSTRAFEVEYWNTIAHLSSGDFLNKNNADCILDKPTQSALRHGWRDLENLGAHLLGYYGKLIAERGMSDAVQFGELPFRWQTEYAFPWMGGWVHNQEGRAYERNLLVRIPGKDRKRAVIMADHYDTAYMYDCYEKEYGGNGARLSAPGADDNCSATVAMMLGAVPFMELSRQGRLACDVWLLHLTGEEYPAEGQGACRMCQWIVEKTLALHTANGKRHDLSNVRIQGVYVLDMIAHNNNKERDIFQIAPGACRESFWLAYQAHMANRTWNLSTEIWNRQPARRNAGKGRRSRSTKVPTLSQYLPLHGEVRPHYDPRSTLFNTDGQMFSDVGVPVVLFMENYDIQRVGYHDTHDNMTNINLDYGAALAAITIESVARAATEEAPFKEPVAK